MALSQSEINNITYDYITRYNLNKERDEKTIKEILIKKGNNRFSIFRYICFVKNYLIVSKNGKYQIDVPSRVERQLLEDLSKACYIKVIKRRKQEHAIQDSEVYFLVNVYQ